MESDKKNICAEGMSQILKKTQDNIFVYDLEGICLYTNNHLANILGFDPVGKHLHEIFPHRSQEHITRILVDYKKIRETQKGDMIPVQKEKIANGETRVFSVTREPIIWMGNPVIAGIGKDITELFLAKEDLEKANEEIKTTNEEIKATNEELSAINDELSIKNEQLEKATKDAEMAKSQMETLMRHVLHDIKNPVASISGFIEVIGQYINNILKNKKFNEEEILKIKNFFEIINISSEKIQGFISDLSQYDKLKKGDLEIKIEEIKIQDFFDTLYKQQCGYLINNNQIANKQNLPQKEISIILDDSIKKLPKSFMSDKKLVDRLFSNLIGNAIKFTDKGTVTIKSEIKGNFIRFYIIDTGVGIPQKDFDKIFLEFQSSSTDYAPIISGSGLGLSIVSKILDKLGGVMLPVKSEVGKGSTFSFELPLY